MQGYICSYHFDEIEPALLMRKLNLPCKWVQGEREPETETTRKHLTKQKLTRTQKEEEWSLMKFWEIFCIYFVINKIKIIKKTNKPINPLINLLGANPLPTTRLAIFQTLVINVLCAWSNNFFTPRFLWEGKYNYFSYVGLPFRFPTTNRIRV